MKFARKAGSKRRSESSAALITHQCTGMSLYQAYFRALVITGMVVMLTGVTLAIGVFTRVTGPINFQTNMGLLLTFVFLWIMLGVLILLFAFACFLLRPPVSEKSGGMERKLWFWSPECSPEQKAAADRLIPPFF